MALIHQLGLIIVLLSVVSMMLNTYYHFSHVVYHRKLKRMTIFAGENQVSQNAVEDGGNDDVDDFNDFEGFGLQQKIDLQIRNITGIKETSQIGSVFKHNPLKRVGTHDCKAIVIDGDESEITKGLDYLLKHPRKFMTEFELEKFARNCTALKERGYITDTISQEELDFPLAFSILMYKEAVQAEMLLRLLYRPHNTYCIHIDMKSPNETVSAMQAIADCFPNVFLAKKREFIVYASVTRLKAELNCMEDALTQSQTWKYYMNYASTMFPLKTNLELVKILKVYNGTNDINGLRPVEARIKYSYKIFNIKNRTKLMRTEELKGPPPLGINITKGSIYATFTRNFCKFMVEDSISKLLLKWSEDTWSPDEHFASTLHHVGRNEEIFGGGIVPGSYTGPISGKVWFGTYAHWGLSKGCPSNYAVHGICINGLRSLKKLTTKPHFSANKFFLTFEPLAWDCMEEWYFNKTFSEPTIDLDYYRKQPFVNNNWMLKQKIKKTSRKIKERPNILKRN